MGMVTAETIGLREYGRGGISMPLRLFAFWKVIHDVSKYKYYPHGWKKHDDEVNRRTVAALRKKGVEPDPESAVYKSTFNLLSARYRDELAAIKKEKKRQEAQWLEQHKTDTDEALLAYLRTAITEPKQMLGPNHITGGHYIVERFGGWQKALRLAGLLPPEETQTPPEEQAQSPPEEQ